MARGDMSTKVVRRATEAGGVVETDEYDKKNAVKEILKMHGMYQKPDVGEVKFLIVRSLDEVEASDG